MSKSDNVTNLIVLALGIFVVYHSYYSLKIGFLISPGAGFLPLLCGLALIALGIVWHLQTIMFKAPSQAADNEDPTVPAPPPRSRVKLCLAFATTVAYACLFERIGFFLATLLFMLSWQMVVERERWPKAVIITIVCAAAMYTLFRYLLRVELPSNPLLS